MKNGLFVLLLLCSATAYCVDKSYWKWVKTDQKDCKYYIQNSFNDIAYVTWTGGCKDGVADGEGVLTVYAKTSPKYGGSYFSYSYSGTLSLGKLSGTGALKYNETNYEKGVFEEGALIKGAISYNNEYMEGEFKNRNLNGKGFMLDKDSTWYEGSFVQNDLEGKGTVIYRNGDTLRGMFLASIEEVTQPEYIYKSDGARFVGKHKTKRDGYKPLHGKVYQGGVHIANIEDGVRVAPRFGPAGKVVKMGQDTYYGDGRMDGVFKPDGEGMIVFANKDTLYATFKDGVAVRDMKYITVNGSDFAGEYKYNKPYTGKFYRGSTLMYEIQDGSVKQAQQTQAATTSDSYPKGQYNPWGTYTKSGSSSTTQQETTKTSPTAGYTKGVLIYKGVSDYDLVVEVEAEALYQVKKSPGMLSFNYIEVAEAKGVRFRYPGNSSTWYNFGSDGAIYSCKDGYKCISIEGMVFKLSSPALR